GSSYVSWRLAPDIDFATPFLAANASAPAEVTRVAAIPSRSEDGTLTFVVDYRFSVDGRTIDGRAWSQRAGAGGDHLGVHYPQGQPERGCPHGMTRRRYPLSSAIFFLGPVIGGLMVLGGTRRGRRAVALLRRGKVGRARLVHKRQTIYEVNDDYVYDL